MGNEIFILAVLLVLSAVFSGTETALVSLSEVKVRNLRDKKRRGSAALTRLKANPQKLLVTILIGNNLVNVAASAIATVVMIDLVGSAGVGIATGIMTFLILVFGEIVPKSFATRNAEFVALFIARPLEAFQFVLFPFIWLFDMFARGAMRFIGGKKTGPTVTEDELLIMAKLGAEEGSILKQEREMLESVFKFNEITTEDVMTPRVEMLTLDSSLKLSDVLKTIIKAPFSRIPVYKKNQDNIIGILYIRDVLIHLANKRTNNIKIKELSKKPYFIPKEKSIDELFKEFQERNIHIAIVLDEYGGTEGLVTLEDLLEELVGEIVDESDVGGKVMMRLDKNTILVDGATEIKAVKRFLNVNLPGKDTDTISELILRKLGRIPRGGEDVKLKHARLIIHDVSEKRINRVKVIKR